VGTAVIRSFAFKNIAGLYAGIELFVLRTMLTSGVQLAIFKNANRFNSDK